MGNFLDRFKRRATLIGGPMDGRVVPIPLPDSMPMPESTCMGGPGPLPRVWHHYERAADDWYRYAGPCAGIDHHGGAPHDHCDHQWDDATDRGHRCELVYGHDGDHACGCCNARATPPHRPSEGQSTREHTSQPTRHVRGVARHRPARQRLPAIRVRVVTSDDAGHAG